MLPVTQIDTFYNGLTLRHRDTINAAAGGTFMKRRPEECYDLIENMTAHHNDWDTSAQRNESSSSITSSNPEIASKSFKVKKNRNLNSSLHKTNVYAVGAYNQGGNSYQPQVRFRERCNEVKCKSGSNNISPIYAEEPMAEVQMTADDNVSATGQQHTEQPEFINEGEVDQNAEQCHDTCPLPAKLTDDKTTELSNQSLESEKLLSLKTVAIQKDFAKLKAYCINLKIQMKDNVLKSGQQSQFLKEKSNEAKVKHDIDVIETINIELEHSVANY
ncbi:hypothetical protein Tco_0103175 [Tanacetum coccineum]